MHSMSVAYMLGIRTVLAIGRTMPQNGTLHWKRRGAFYLSNSYDLCSQAGLTNMMWTAVLFCSSPQQTEHPHLCSRGQQVPSHPGPHLLFPLCWAQCSFLATQFLILALLAYLNLAETKHGFIWWFASEERWWWHFVVNCLHMWGRLDIFYLGRAGKNKDRVYLFWVLRMFSLLKRYWARGWWLRGLLPCLLISYCFSVSLSVMG